MPTPEELAARRAKIEGATPRGLRKKNPQKKSLWIAVGLVVALVLAGLGWALWNQKNHKDEVRKTTQQAVAPPHATKDGGGVVANPGKAKPGAPTLKIYQDFQCPMCKKADGIFGSTVTALADQGKINLEYHMRTFLDDGIKQALGNKVPNPDSSVRAAEGALCADEQGFFKAYHDEVYRNQPEREGQGYSKKLLRDTIPASIGLKGDALKSFQSCVDDKRMHGYVVQMEQQGAKDGNNATPEYYLNGKVLDLDALAKTPGSLEKEVAAATK